MEPGSPDITGLLTKWRSGDRAAEAELMNAVYPVLRDIARSRLRRSPNDLTLRATELANEAYARLAEIQQITFNDRIHFFAVAARAIRNFVVDHVRAKVSDKRGGGLPFVPLDATDEASDNDVLDLRVDWLAVHAALNELEQLDPVCGEIVELKFFSGLTTDEIAEASGKSRATVVRNWRFARAWLADRLRDHG